MFFFSSRRRHTRLQGDWSSDVCSSDLDLDCPFRGFRREALSRLKLYGELYGYIPILVARNGFRMTEVPVENRPRLRGESKFGAERFLRGGLDLFTILFLTRYLGRPLHLFGGLGLLAGAVGFPIVAGVQPEEPPAGTHSPFNLVCRLLL